MAYKMTSTLIAQYQWFRDCPSSWKDRALDGLKATLTQGFTASTATIRGEKFEKEVNYQLNQKQKFTGFMAPLNFCMGMEQQRWLSPLYVDLGAHENFIFRGRMDYLGKGNYPSKKYKNPSRLQSLHGVSCVCDLKTTGSPIREEKYSRSVQHIVYMLATGVQDFVYFVAQFTTDSGLEPCDLQFFHFVRTDDAMEILQKEIEGCVKILKDYNLWDDYVNVFCGGRG